MPTAAARSKKAPQFALRDQGGDEHQLHDYAGRPLVIFFYPKDDTSVCTREACEFRDLLPRFESAGVAVLGISILGEASKRRFAEKHSIPFPLLADDRLDAAGKPDPLVSRRYGVWVEKSMYGRTYMGIERTTVLVDAKGRIVRRWDKVKVPGHAAEVLEAALLLA